VSFLTTDEVPAGERPCSRCGERPRLDGQRWCRDCLSAAQRDRRAARRAPGLAVNGTMPPPSPSVGPEADESRDPLCRPSGAPRVVPEAQHARRASTGDQPAIGDVGHSPDATAAAVERYQRARTELDRVTRFTDWRRSCYSPSVVLTPFVDTVTRAQAECRRLGVAENRLRDLR
jgi:hypothetical protein